MAPMEVVEKIFEPDLINLTPSLDSMEKNLQVEEESLIEPVEVVEKKNLHEILAEKKNLQVQECSMDKNLQKVIEEKKDLQVEEESLMDSVELVETKKKEEECIEEKKKMQEERLMESVEAVEKILNYSFSNKNLLKDTLKQNDVGKQPLLFRRLEFLGDSVLGFVFTNYFHLTFPDLKDKELKELQSVNVCNDKFARVAVKRGLLPYVVCDSWVNKIKAFSEAVSKDDDLVWYKGSMEAPKILADFVEAIAGAVYIDVNFDLLRFWEILKGLLEPLFMPDDICHYQPVVMLHRMAKKRKRVVFKYCIEDETRIVAKVYFSGKFIASGYGKTVDSAKIAAAKEALQKLSECMMSIGERSSVDVEKEADNGSLDLEKGHGSVEMDHIQTRSCIRKIQLQKSLEVSKNLLKKIRSERKKNRQMKKRSEKKKNLQMQESLEEKKNLQMKEECIEEKANLEMQESLEDKEKQNLQLQESLEDKQKQNLQMQESLEDKQKQNLQMQERLEENQDLQMHESLEEKHDLPMHETLEEKPSLQMPESLEDKQSQNLQMQESLAENQILQTHESSEEKHDLPMHETLEEKPSLQMQEILEEKQMQESLEEKQKQNLQMQESLEENQDLQTHEILEEKHDLPMHETLEEKPSLQMPESLVEKTNLEKKESLQEKTNQVMQESLEEKPNLQTHESLEEKHDLQMHESSEEKHDLQIQESLEEKPNMQMHGNLEEKHDLQMHESSEEKRDLQIQKSLEEKQDLQTHGSLESKKNLQMNSLEALEKILNYCFSNKSLLKEAITHKSGMMSRLKILGNTALGLSFTKYLYFTYPNLSTLGLSRLLSVNKSSEKFARVAVKHGLDKFLVLGRSFLPSFDEKVKLFSEAVSKEDGPVPYGGLVVSPRMLNDLVVSIAGAIYVDVNFNVARLWEIYKGLFEPLYTVGDLWWQPQPVRTLIRLGNKHGKEINFRYGKGPDKHSTCEVYLDDKFIACGRSKSDKVAKRAAAMVTLVMLSKSMPLETEEETVVENTKMETAEEKFELIRICRKRKWPKPIFSVVSQDHEKGFVCSAEIKTPTEGTLIIKGDSRKKRKVAEYSSASHMIRALEFSTKDDLGSLKMPP